MVLHSSARVFRVRTDFVAFRREVRVHVLCECGSGAWLASIAPFYDLFFDERLLVGRTVGEGLACLRKRYGGLRLLTDVGEGASDGGTPLRRTRKARGTGRRASGASGQRELTLALPS